MDSPDLSRPNGPSGVGKRAPFSSATPSSSRPSSRSGSRSRSGSLLNPRTLPAPSSPSILSTSPSDLAVPRPAAASLSGLPGRARSGSDLSRRSVTWSLPPPATTPGQDVQAAGSTGKPANGLGLPAETTSPKRLRSPRTSLTNLRNSLRDPAGTLGVLEPVATDSAPATGSYPLVSDLATYPPSRSGSPLIPSLRAQAPLSGSNYESPMLGPVPESALINGEMGLLSSPNSRPAGLQADYDMSALNTPVSGMPPTFDAAATRSRSGTLMSAAGSVETTNTTTPLRPTRPRVGRSRSSTIASIVSVDTFYYVRDYPVETAAFGTVHLGMFLKKKWWPWYLLIGIIVILTVVVTIFHHTIVVALLPVSRKLRDLPAGWLIPIMIIFVLSFPPLFGAELVIILVGIIWGLWIGFGIVCAGTFIGEVGNFYAFKGICTGRSRKLEQTSPNYRCMTRLVRMGGFKTACLARFSAIPGHFTTAVFASTGMSIWVFMAAAVISLPKQLAIVYLGTFFLTEGSKRSTASKVIQYLVVIFTFIITCAVAWYLYREMAKIRPSVLREIAEEEEVRRANTIENGHARPTFATIYEDETPRSEYPDEGVETPMKYVDLDASSPSITATHVLTSHARTTTLTQQAEILPLAALDQRTDPTPTITVDSPQSPPRTSNAVFALPQPNDESAPERPSHNHYFPST